jgi:hypothetical protein
VPRSFGEKMKLKQGDIKTRKKGHLTPVLCKETKCKKLMKVYSPPEKVISVMSMAKL